MEQIEKKKYEETEPEEEEKEEEVVIITDENLEEKLKEIDDPVIAQKRLAIQVKNFLDQRIKVEMKKDGILTDHTRRWVESYNNILEKIQKALHGTKSVSLNLHKVTHAMIASKVRDSDKE